MEKEEILQFIDLCWKFDENQQPISSWHDKQDLLKALEKTLNFKYLNSEQTKRLSEMIKNAARSGFIQGGGAESEFNHWWKNKNKLDLNKEL
jgi:hypothetical protein